MLLITSTAVLLMRSVAGLILPEVDNYFLGFNHVQDEVVDSATAQELLHLLSLGQVVVITDETHHCSVIHEPQTVVGGSSWDTVVCHEAEQQRAQHTLLGGPCAESDDTGGVLTYPH